MQSVKKVDSRSNFQNKNLDRNFCLGKDSKIRI